MRVDIRVCTDIDVYMLAPLTLNPKPQTLNPKSPSPCRSLQQNGAGPLPHLRAAGWVSRETPCRFRNGV